MHFRILGPLEILDDERRSIELDSPKLRAVICRLLMDAGRVIPDDVLIAALWGDDPPSAAAGTLQTYVSRLRRILEPDRPPRAPARVLVTRPPGYLLAIGDGTLDAVELARMVESAAVALDAGRAADAASALGGARDLWRGRPLADVADEPFAASAVARLVQLHLTALEMEVDAWLALGRLGSAIAELEGLVRDEPLHERYWAQLITALYRSGRQADALSSYARCRTMLRDELGLDPGPELQALESAVLGHDPLLAVAPRTTDRDGQTAVIAGGPADPRGFERIGAGAGVADRGTGTVVGFVGRDSELAVLADAVRSALSGRGTVIAIDGEAGIGKSRLAEAATEFAATNGMTVVWTYCLDEIGAPPLWPWLQARDATATPTSLDDEDVAKEAVVVKDADPAAARFREIANLVEDLSRSARDRPLMVVVDDMQWADQASIQLLRLLVGQVGSTPMVTIVTVRRPDAESNQVLDSALIDMLRSPNHRRLRLAGLNAVEAAELVTSISGRHEPELAHSLRARTGGNPFFLSEIAKLVAAEAGDGPAASAASVAVLVPDTVREVVERRVQRLPDDTQALMRFAAVAGSSVELDVLEQVTGLDGERVCTLLEPAVVAGLLVEVDDRIGWRFSHALAQDAVRSTLTRHTRARLHAALADAIRDVHADDRHLYLDELAHHSYEAAQVGQSATALGWSVAAARAAHDGHGHDRAAFHWDRALSLLGSTGAADIERYELLVSFAEDLRLMGDLDGARARLEEAIRIARRLDDDERAARAAVIFGGVTLWYWRRYGTTDRAMVDEVRRLAGSAKGTQRIELLGTLGVELYYSAERTEGIAAAEQAVALARESDDVALLGRSLNNFVLAVWEPRVDLDRLAAINESLSYAGRGLPLQTEVIARVHRAAINLRLGEIEAAEADLGLCHGIAAELAVPELRAAMLYASGGLAMLRGQWADAERLAHKAFEVQSRTSLWGAEWAKVMQLVSIHSAQGRIADIVGEALRIAALPGMDATHPLAALAVAEDGDHDKARHLAELWWDPDHQPDWTSDHQAADWGTLAALVGYPDPQLCYNRLIPFADRLVVAGTAVACRGSFQFVLGRLALALGDPDTARRHFLASRDRDAAVGATWHADQAQANLARLA